MMKLKAKYHGSCKSNYNARSCTRKYDEAQSKAQGEEECAHGNTYSPA